MLNLDVRVNENIVIATPDAVITSVDLDTMTTAINGYINEHDRVPNLIIHAKNRPHWKSFGALEKHLKFVKDHHKVVKKVAIVSDSKLLWIAKTIVDHFTSAKIRRFEEDALEDAIAWAQVEDDHPGSVEQIKDLPDDVLGLDLRGLITAQDYSGTITPLVETKLKAHDEIKLMCVLGDYFDGYSANAMWDDLSLGFRHLTTFSKLALVTDEDWIRNGAKVFGMLMPTEVMVFHNSEFDQAKAWISET